VLQNSQKLGHSNTKTPNEIKVSCLSGAHHLYYFLLGCCLFSISCLHLTFFFFVVLFYLVKYETLVADKVLLNQANSVSLAHMIQATVCSKEANVSNKCSSIVDSLINGGTNPVLFVYIMYNRSYHMCFHHLFVSALCWYLGKSSCVDLNKICIETQIKGSLVLMALIQRKSMNVSKQYTNNIPKDLM
jgi:hypothetical protein